MIATLSIYAVGVLLCLLAGTALAGLLGPTGAWIGIATIPLGFCVLVTLLYPIGWVVGSTIATPIVIGIIVVGLAVAVVLRLRRAEPGTPLAAALWPGATGLVVLGTGILAGALLLAATIDQGFATTIGVTNNDGWGYATLVDWLQHDPMPSDVAPSIADPLTLVPWTTSRLHFGVGFEHVAAMLATLLGREGFEVVNAAAAVGLAAAVGGWAALAGALRRDLRPATAALVAVAVASPALVIPFVENYTTQFVALCLWPFADGHGRPARERARMADPAARRAGLRNGDRGLPRRVALARAAGGRGRAARARRAVVGLLAPAPARRRRACGGAWAGPRC